MIYNLQGELLQDTSLQIETRFFELSALKPGLYVFQFQH